MKFVRFEAGGVTCEGFLEDQEILSDGACHALSSVRLLAPCRPSKIVCVGRNYFEHAKEMDSDLPDVPLLFFKPPSAVLDPGADIVYPPQSTRVDYEGELAVVIGHRCRSVTRHEALSFVRGYTVFNDVTARDLQKSDGQWARAKGFDTFAPFGPCIVDDVDPSRLHIRTLLNGNVRQDSPTAKMIFDVPTLIEFISAAFTLEPGDLIATGTPSGVGPMHPGDNVRVEIEGIGALVNRVVAAG
jgi:2-keto-4-pentenoate hydratase/2-oxohepta-3-ene-1,7-dioic acid hydratase in catechol pathway